MRHLSLGAVSWAVLDQAAYGAIQLLPSLWLAQRWPAAHYGAYSVCMAVVFFALGMHSALLLEPMLALPQRQLLERSGYLGGLLRLHGWLCCAAWLAFSAVGAAVYVVSPELGLALLGSGVAAAAALSLSLLRRLTQLLAPARSVWGTLTSGVHLLLGLVLLQHWGALQPWSVLLWMGSATPLYVLWLRRSVGPAHQSVSSVWAEHWPQARWLLGLSPLRWALDSLPLVLVGAGLGLTQAAALRAVSNLVAPIIQILGAVRLAQLPGFARAVEARQVRQFTRQNIFLMCGLSALNYVVLWLWGAPLMHWVYAARYDAYVHLLPWLGLLPVLLGTALTFGSILRAQQQSRRSFQAFLCAALVCNLTLVLSLKSGGLWAAVVCMLAGYAALLLYKFAHARRALTQD